MTHLRPVESFTVALIALLLLAGPGFADDQGQNADREQELIAVLQSDAPAAEKAVTCKYLAVYGSNQAVPELAKLLGDEQLSSWARIALEAIPGTEADDALRTALESVEGRQLIGVINSIGVRRDENAVEALADRLTDGDVAVVSSAAAALGQIGNEPAADFLRQALADGPAGVRPAAAEGCVLCAERFLAEGNAELAAAIYDEVRHADVPRPRILEATRGAILARKQDGIPLLVEQLRSSEKDLFQLALSTAREFPGDRIDQALADEIPKVEPQRAALVVLAMADREATVSLPAVLEAAVDGPKPVRLAAISSLGRVGDESCLAPLLSIATEDDAELTQMAKAALRQLPGKNVDADLLALVPNSQGAAYRVLIEQIGERRILATDLLLKAVEHDDAATRHAALASLGKTVIPEELSILVSNVVSPRHENDTEAAQRALKEAAVRMPEREVCALELSAAMDGASIPTQSVLLEILGAVGGTKALQAVGTAAKSGSPEPLRDVSTRLLGEWMTIDAAPVLLELATSGPFDKYQVRAIRGYIRIARQFNMPDAIRVEMCRKAIGAARRSADKQLVLEVVERYPNRQMLTLAVEAMDDAELKDRATQAALVIADKLKDNDGSVQEILAKAGFQKVELEIIKAEYGAGQTQKDVTEFVKKHAGNLQLLTLPSRNYNESFGGDPVPQTPKQLKIQYRINGKPGEATFAENSLIVLPIPK
jgi:HEAT repeat protein